MCLVARKPIFGFLTRSNTNGAVGQHEVRGLGRRETIFVAKKMGLISCAATVQLIGVFVFAYAKSCFSHDVAYMVFRDTNLVCHHAVLEK